MSKKLYVYEFVVCEEIVAGSKSAASRQANELAQELCATHHELIDVLNLGTDDDEGEDD